MLTVATRVAFSESNNATLVYVSAGLTAVLLAVDHATRIASSSQSNVVYDAALLVFLLTAVVGLNSLMRCVWHPIPKEHRADGELTNLHLTDRVAAETHAAPDQMFASAEDQVSTSDEDEESVTSTEIELRDPIQWRKMSLILLCAGADVMLMIIWAH